ncbi:MAG TPA: DUF1592 domain-containing protein [Polyangia bacterium]
MRIRLVAVVFLAACTGQINERPPSGPGSSAPGTDGTMPVKPGEGGGMAPSGMTEPERPAGPPPLRCDQPFVGAPALLRLRAQELSNSLRDIFPQAKDASLLDIADPLDRETGFIVPTQLLVGEGSVEKLVGAAQLIADAMVTPDTLNAVLPCAAAAKDAACVGKLIQRYGRRLFRRPLTSEEQQRYLQLHETAAAKGDFALGIKWVLVALITSPNTLYRRQVGKPMGKGVSQLTQWELASELAYTFTGSTPSDALLSKAEKGSLSSPEALIAEARALLDTPAGRRTISEYFERWLSYDLVSSNQRDNIPAFATLRGKLAEETRVFLEKVVHTDKGGIRDLLTAPYTMVDGALAKYYGMTAAGDGFVSVARPKGQGIGLLAQGSLLAERSQTFNSSPTRRGILIRKKLLCLDIPEVPAVVPDLPSVGKGWKTTRQRFETAHAQGACASCHRLFDPLGFPFEHFDEGGRFRANENGEPIDASGYALDADGNTLFTVKGGQEELATLLAGRPEVTACVAETLAKYLTSQSQSCVAGESRNDFVDGKIGLLDYAARLAGAPHFSQRRGP